MKSLILVLSFFCLVGCTDNNLIEQTSKDYIDFLSKDVNADFNVFVREVISENNEVFRFNSSTHNLKSGEVPSSFLEYKNRYIFFFYLDSISSVNVQELKDRGLYTVKEGLYSEEDYDEWILAVCDEKKYTLIKDSWYRPLDSLEKLQNFQCNR